MDEPRGYVVVGETDWWDVGERNADNLVVSVDSRLRNANAQFWTTGTRSIYSAGRVRPGPAPVYAEFLTVFSGATTTIGVGVSRATYSGTDARATGAGLGAAFYFGNTYNGTGTAVDSGLGNTTGGDVLGLLMWLDGDDGRVQFSRNGTPLGSALTVDADTEYSLCGLFGGVRGLVMCVDAGDPFADFPAGAQPWGAAARVADRGGYSRAATVFTRSDSDFTLDSFARTSSGSAVVTGLSICDDAPRLSNSAAIFYVEFPVEVDSGVAGIIGLESRNLSTANSVGGSGGFGFFIHTGEKRTGSVNVSYSSATGAASNERFGVLWEPSSGKVYFSKNEVILNSGDPKAGTGFAFDTATGDLVPAVTPFQGRIRLCTHAREQQHRPSYAEAWDGSDLLPEQHFTDRLRRAPSVRREVSYYPWANQRNRGAAIGNVELGNADGVFDALSDWDLRDQEIIAYRVRDDGSTVREFTGLIDGVTLPDARTCRIAVADVSAKLDVRVDSPVFAVGQVESAPVLPQNGTTLTSDVCQEPRSAFAVLDQGLAVTSFVREDTDSVAAFRRTVSPAGLQSVQTLRVQRIVQALSIPNQDLEDWIGTDPDAWDTAAGGTGSVARDGANNRLVVNAGNNTAVAGFECGFSGGTPYSIQIAYTAYNNAGEVRFWASDSAADALSGVGENYALINQPSGPSSGLITLSVDIGAGRLYGIIRATGTASITIDYVRAWETEDTSLPADAMDYLINERAGSVLSYEFSSFGGNYPRTNFVGPWSQENPTIRMLVESINGSLLLDYFTDQNGDLRFAALIPPEEVTLAADGFLGEIAESDVYGDVSVSDDYAPALTDQARFNPNFVQHSDGDIAGAVTTEDRQYLTSEGKVNKLDLGASALARAAKPFHPFYSFAVDGPIWERVIVGDLTDDPDPLSVSLTDKPLILLHRCYASRRRFYRLRISRTKADELALRPGGVVDLTHRRYGLSIGKNLLVIVIEPQLMSPTVSLTLWG